MNYKINDETLARILVYEGELCAFQDRLSKAGFEINDRVCPMGNYALMEIVLDVIGAWPDTTLNADGSENKSRDRTCRDWFIDTMHAATHKKKALTLEAAVKLIQKWREGIGEWSGATPKSQPTESQHFAA